MITLFLDLGSHNGTIALVSDDHVLALEPIDHRMSDAELVPLYESLLKKNDLEPKNLSRLACVLGPGGFTSLRCAVAFINALGFVLKIPSSGIHLSDLYKARTADPDNTVWLHSTKKTALFLRKLTEPDTNLVEVGDLQNQVEDATGWTGELIPEHQQLITLKPAQLKSLEDVLPTFLAQQTYENQILEPWYGRGY